MALRIDVRPELLVWARERAGIDFDELTAKFPKLPDWERGALAPTLRQLESFARTTRTSVGYLLLREPPHQPLPVPDYRTVGDAELGHPSPDLLDTIFLCQRRQEWYAEFARASGEDAVTIVGSLTTGDQVVEAAATMRRLLRFAIEERPRTWDETLRDLIERAEDLGVLVMVSSVVGNDNHRKLRVEEFRGFALVDQFAPLAFVNAADTRSAQIFTLAHELAHIWLGESALSDADVRTLPDRESERWCNQVAAEFLVPMADLRGAYRHDDLLTDELARLGKRYKVSTLVIVRRLFEGQFLTRVEYQETYEAELQRVLEILDELPARDSGNFYNTQPRRSSRRFLRALVTSTLEGHTLYRDAFQMLGISSAATFSELADRLRRD